MSEDKTALIAANRSRYEALKRDGQGHAPLALPGPSPRPAPEIPPGTLMHRELIAEGWYFATRLRAGEALRLVNLSGSASVAFVAWSFADPSERLNYADSVKVQWTAALGKGRVLFSDMGRVMVSIIEDSYGLHDALVGGSTAPSNAARYGDAGLRRNTRDNLLLIAAKLGLSRRDVPPAVSFFAPVRTDSAGRFVWRDAPARSAGDYVDLRAEMDLWVGLSNCPHPFDPAPAYAPGEVEVIRYRAAKPGADDLCRGASAEARRGFENTLALVL